MNKDKYVFSQLLEFLDYDKFRHLVDKYDGNKYVKYLTLLESTSSSDVWSAQ